jgi:NAD(P)-dependent dehydrogenase (short-subunit alcohol dehydrogenase family)
MASENYPTYADLANKVAVVTGGSRGIGAVTCRLLAENGAKVTVGGRDEAAINSVRPARRPRQLPGPILRAHRAGEAPDAGGNPATGGGDAPLGRMGTPEDVALATLFLASESSSWITGVTLDVACGRTMV